MRVVRLTTLWFSRARPVRSGSATRSVAMSEPRKRRASERPRIGCDQELGARFLRRSLGLRIVEAPKSMWKKMEEGDDLKQVMNSSIKSEECDYDGQVLHRRENRRLTRDDENESNK